VEPLVSAMRSRFGDGARVVLTCQTATGRALGLGLAFDEVRFAPIDSARAVARAIRHFRPNLFLVAETEIWPELLTALARAAVPSAIVSARVSARSFSRYRHARSLFGPPLATLARVCARDTESAERFVALGARPEVTTVCGDLKLDALDDAIVRTTPSTLAAPGNGPRHLLAISTHAGEEATVLEAFARLRASHAPLRLVLAPRHPERRAEVQALAGALCRTILWSSRRANDESDWEVLVVDTTGELRGFLKGASAAFVGGSLVAVGGHNLAEPAAFRVPVATGPRLENVAHQAELLDRAGALVVVHDAEELAAAWARWLDDPTAARHAADAAYAAFAASRGALARTVAAIEPSLAQVAHLAQLAREKQRIR